MMDPTHTKTIAKFILHSIHVLTLCFLNSFFIDPDSIIYQKAFLPKLSNFNVYLGYYKGDKR